MVVMADLIQKCVRQAPEMNELKWRQTTSPFKQWFCSIQFGTHSKLYLQLSLEKEKQLDILNISIHALWSSNNHSISFNRNDGVQNNHAWKKWKRSWTLGGLQIQVLRFIHLHTTLPKFIHLSSNNNSASRLRDQRHFQQMFHAVIINQQ